MSTPLIVLKFGGSVLLGKDRLPDAVGEIQRWRRDGWHVVAVVSAFAGRTDALIRFGTPALPGGHAFASLLATGEQESAAHLGVQLDGAGVQAAVLSPGAIGLRAQGEPCDADPVRVDGAALRAALNACGVVVVPGFTGVDELGRHVTFGRGGSDLSALFLAHALDAGRCRLIKDVDGLYESDPAAPGPEPRRYACASYADALRTDGSIVQHKSVRFARRVGLRFEIGRAGGEQPTHVGPHESVFGVVCTSPCGCGVASTSI